MAKDLGAKWDAIGWLGGLAFLTLWVLLFIGEPDLWDRVLDRPGDTNAVTRVSINGCDYIGSTNASGVVSQDSSKHNHRSKHKHSGHDHASHNH